MNRYLLLVLVALTLGLPASADTIIQSLEDSQVSEYHNIILDRFGRTEDQINRITTYTYLTNTGEKVNKDYKIKNLPDNRLVGKKHPILKYIILMYNHIQVVIPI